MTKQLTPFGYFQCACLAGALLMAPLAAQARATAEEAAQLGKSLTCLGAEKAGTATGVAEYTGKWLGAAPGMTSEPGKHPTDPYADEKPLFTITAQNAEQYAARLSEGQKAMFRKYPNTYKMHIYPSHRDFRHDDAMCKVAAQNAASAELTPEGMGVLHGHIGAAPFPFPKTGLELAWNTLLPVRVAWDLRDTDTAVVYPNGTIMRGWQIIWGYSRVSDPRLRGSAYEGTSSTILGLALLPEREKGTVKLINDYFNYAQNSRQGWFYNPDTRRVRQLPGYGYDQSIESSGGTVMVDDARMFNGPPDRYQWKILGKREIYIPYNGFRLEGRPIGENRYAALLNPGHENPAFVRWELHRVWILEATLKEGYRHLYARRTLFIDEDSWQSVMADNFDARGKLWRYNWLNLYYVPGANIFNAGSSFYHDLDSGTYSAFDLAQAKTKSYLVNPPGVDYDKTDFYTIENMKSIGY
jgi:hypothetical protein